MSLKERTPRKVLKKQCNIGKHETFQTGYFHNDQGLFNGCKVVKSLSASLRQTNVVNSPLTYNFNANSLRNNKSHNLVTKKPYQNDNHNVRFAHFHREQSYRNPASYDDLVCSRNAERGHSLSNTYNIEQPSKFDHVDMQHDSKNEQCHQTMDGVSASGFPISNDYYPSDKKFNSQSHAKNTSSADQRNMRIRNKNSALNKQKKPEQKKQVVPQLSKTTTRVDSQTSPPLRIYDLDLFKSQLLSTQMFPSPRELQNIDGESHLHKTGDSLEVSTIAPLEGELGFLHKSGGRHAIKHLFEGSQFLRDQNFFAEKSQSKNDSQFLVHQAVNQKASPRKQVTFDLGNSCKEMETSTNKLPRFDGTISWNLSADENSDLPHLESHERDVTIGELCSEEPTFDVSGFNLIDDILSLRNMNAVPIDEIPSLLSNDLSSSFQDDEVIHNDSDVISSCDVISGDVISCDFDKHNLKLMSDVDVEKEDYEVDYDITSTDEEDTLHLSLNTHSFDSMHLTSLGATLRLLRLHRVLQKLNENERQDLMRKYRYFIRWQKNSKSNRFVRTQRIMKWHKATLHFNQQMMSKHFHAWNSYNRDCKLQADSLYKKHMQSKGIEALKWLVLKCKKRDDWLSQRKNRNLIGQAYRKWKERFHSSRSERLQVAWARWTTHYRHSVILNVLHEKKQRRSLIKFYCNWRQRFQQRQVENIATLFHSMAVKKRVFHAWTIFVADCDVHRTQDVVASEHSQIQTLMKTFNRWKSTFHKLTKAKCFFKKKHQRNVISIWQQVTPQLKLFHIKQLSFAHQLRHKHLLRNTWKEWVTEMRVDTKIKEKKNKNLRLAFSLWKAELKNKIRLNILAEKFNKKLTLKRGFLRWKGSCYEAESRRCKAAHHIKRSVIRNFFQTWMDFVQEKKENREKMLKFHAQRKMLQQRDAFMKWKSLYYAIFMENEKRNQWRENCVRKAIKKWLDFVKTKNMKKRFEDVKTKKSICLVSRCFINWKNSYNSELNKAKKADELFDLLNKSRCVRIVKEWNKMTQESHIIRPYVEKRNRKQCTKIFDAWRGFLIKKKILINQSEAIKQNKMNVYFSRWMRECFKRERIAEAQERGVQNIKRRAFLSWRKFVIRQRNFKTLSQRHTIDIAKVTFNRWAIRAQQRHLAVEKAIQTEIKNRQILSECFSRWKQEVLCEKILREDATSWFIKGHELDLKLATFKQWKKCLANKRMADGFAQVKLKNLLSCLLSGWNLLTQRNIRKRSNDFAESLKSFCDVTNDARCDSQSQSSSSSCDISNDAMTDRSREQSLADHVIACDSGVELIRDYCSESSSVLFTYMKHIEPSTNTTPTSFCVENQQFPYISEVREVELRCTSENYTSSNVGSLCDDVTVSDDLTVSDDIISGDVTMTCDGSATENSSVELTLDDLMSCHGDDIETGSEGSDDVITQREISTYDIIGDDVIESCNGSPCLSSDDIIHSRDDVTISARPRHGFEVITKESTQSRLEKLVHFSVSRFSSPSLSHAFYQWKLLSHATKWDKSMLSRAYRQIEKQKLNYCFMLWQDNYGKSCRAKNFCASKLIRPILLSWKQWSQERKGKERMENEAKTINNHRLLRLFFENWMKRLKQRNSLNEILKYWKSRIADSNMLSQQSMEVQRKHDTVIVQRCVTIWKLRYRQLQKCDFHYKKNITRKFLAVWYQHSYKRAVERHEVRSIHEQLFKRRILRVWRRKLFIEEKVEILRRRSLKKWLAGLITRWQQWAKDSYERQICLVYLENKKEKSSLGRNFQIWHHKFCLRQIADQSRNRALLYKSTTYWRKYVLERKSRLEKLREIKMERNKMQISECFNSWYRSLTLLLIGRDFKINKQRICWSRWKFALKLKRFENITRNLILRQYFSLWVSSHENRLRDLELSRTVVVKWHSVTIKHRHLSKQADTFMQSRCGFMKKIIFKRWIISYEKSQQSKHHFRSRQLQRFFRIWFLCVENEKRKKSEISIFFKIQEERVLLLMWQRWRGELIQRTSHEHAIECIQDTWRQRRQHNVWLLWRLRINVKKAVKFFERNLILKVMTSWHDAVASNQSKKFKLEKLEILWKIRTKSSSFKMWNFALQRRKLSSSFYEKITKKQIIIQWRNFVTSAVKMKRNFEEVRCLHEENIMKGCLFAWKERLLVVQNMSFLADEMSLKSQHYVVVESWLLWKSQFNQRKLKIIRERIIERKVITKWRMFVRKMVYKSEMYEFRKMALMRRAFKQWQLLHKAKLLSRKRDCDVIKRAWSLWARKTSMSIFAETHNEYKIVRKTWSAWRLRYALAHAEVDSWKEMENGVLMTSFQSWRSRCLKVVPRDFVEQQSKIPRLKRK